MPAREESLPPLPCSDAQMLECDASVAVSPPRCPRLRFLSDLCCGVAALIYVNCSGIMSSVSRNFLLSEVLAMAIL